MVPEEHAMPARHAMPEWLWKQRESRRRTVAEGLPDRVMPGRQKLLPWPGPEKRKARRQGEETTRLEFGNGCGYLPNQSTDFAGVANLFRGLQ